MILNRQRGVRVSVRALENFLARARLVLGIPKDALTVALVSDAEIARWNYAYRGKNRSTDVLSFPADGAHRKQKKPAARGRVSPRTRDRSPRSPASAPPPSNYLGDIAISPVVALSNSR